MSQALVLCIEFHQPYRLRPLAAWDIARQHDYFTDTGPSEYNNQRVFLRECERTYRPLLHMLQTTLAEQPVGLTCVISGTWLEQAQAWAPDVVTSMQALVATGRVELLGHTYYHSLAWWHDTHEHQRQVRQHQAAMQTAFGLTPTAYSNTGTTADSALAAWAHRSGYRTLLAQAGPGDLGWRSPNHLDQRAGIPVLLVNQRLSQLYQRQSAANRSARDYATRMQYDSPGAEIITLYISAEQTQPPAGGTDFLRRLMTDWLSRGNTMASASYAARTHSVRDTIELTPPPPQYNDLQRDALRYTYQLAPSVAEAAASIQQDYRRLLASDYLAYLADDPAGSYSPYTSKHDAFLWYMNTLRDIAWRAQHDT